MTTHIILEAKGRSRCEDSRSAQLEDEMWRRRQDRRDAVMMTEDATIEARLVPLILALARLSAQRDAAAMKALADG